MTQFKRILHDVSVSLILFLNQTIRWHLPAWEKALLFLASSTGGKMRWSGFRIWLCLCLISIFHSLQDWRKFSIAGGKSELKSRMQGLKCNMPFKKDHSGFSTIALSCFRQCYGQKQIIKQWGQNKTHLICSLL